MDQPRGWQLNKSVLRCNEHMLESRLASDVIIVLTAGDGGGGGPGHGQRPVELPAHKYVLVSRSPVFEAMLCGDFNEGASEVVITDVEGDSFRQLLRYMYCERANITEHNVLPVLFVSKKYMVEGLVKICVSFLKENISHENVCTILNHCVMYDEKDLIQRCLKYIGPRTNEILQSEGFLELSKPALHQVVHHDRLIVDSECDVLSACKAWATHHVQAELDGAPPLSKDSKSAGSGADVSDSEIRDALGETLYHVRFATMRAEDLARAVGSSKLLTDEETRVLFCHLSTWNYGERLKKMNFNLKPRPTTYECCRRFWQVNGGWNYNRGLTDAISFQVDRPIWLMGVAVYGGEIPGDTHDYRLELHNGNTHQWVCTCQGQIETDGTDNSIPVHLKEPQRLEPGSAHTVRLLMTGPKSYFGERGLRTVRQAGVKFTFTSSSESINETVVAGGQIPELIFRKI